MGKVLQKLAERQEVKSLNKTGDEIKIVLADGYSQEDGSVETVVTTAHAARMWIQAASNGVKKTVRTSSTGETIVDEGPQVEKYPGLPPEFRKPIWELPKNFSPNDAEGRDAYRRGYAKTSHYAGESSAAKEFESAWEQERRLDEARKAKEAEWAAENKEAIASSNAWVDANGLPLATPDEDEDDLGAAGEMAMFLSDLAA